MSTMSKFFAARSSSGLKPIGSERHRLGAISGRDDAEILGHLNRRKVLLTSRQRESESVIVRQIEYPVNERASDISVDEEHAALTGLAEGQGEIDRRQGLPFAR